MDVDVTYEYIIVAGKGRTTARSLAQEAINIAKEFYGDLPFKAEIEVVGRGGQWNVNGRAQGKVSVPGDQWT